MASDTVGVHGGHDLDAVTGVDYVVARRRHQGMTIPSSESCSMTSCTTGPSDREAGSGVGARVVHPSGRSPSSPVSDVRLFLGNVESNRCQVEAHP